MDAAILQDAASTAANSVVAAKASSLAPAASWPDSLGCRDSAGHGLQDSKFMWQPKPASQLRQHLGQIHMNAAILQTPAFKI